MESITLREIANEIKKTPTAILGNPQIGKSNMAKLLVQELKAIPNVKIRVWDASTEWLFNSPTEKIYTVPNPKIVVYSDMNPYQPTELVAYNQTFTDTYLETLLNDKCVGFDSSELDDILYEREFQKRLVHIDKANQIKAVKQNKGEINDYIVWVCEESQGVFSSNSLRRRENLWLAKLISISANFGISWLIITRRASEVSTKVFEHTNVKCVFNSSQPNSIRKLKTILSFNAIETMRTMGIGECVVLTNKGEFYLKTPKFKGKNPTIYTTIISKKRKGLVDKLKSLLSRFF